MKKVLATLSLILALGIGANAQSDGFFSYSIEDESRTEQGLPLLPPRGAQGDQNADAPIGSGLLLLAGMGVAYAVKRRK